MLDLSSRLGPSFPARRLALGALCALAVALSPGIAPAQSPSPPAASPGAPPAPPGAPPAQAPPGAPPAGVPPSAWPPPSAHPGYVPIPANELPPGYAPPLGYMPIYDPSAADPTSLPPPPPRKLYSVPMIVGGILMIAGGLGSAAAGAYLISSSKDRIEIYCDGPFLCATVDDVNRRGAGIALMVVGAVVGAAGIPLWALGARTVAVKSDDQKPPARPAWQAPEVRVGAGSASLTLRF
jgi:hypothetical protein